MSVVELTKQYRSLLRQDATPQAVDDCMDLIDAALRVRIEISDGGGVVVKYEDQPESEGEVLPAPKLPAGLEHMALVAANLPRVESATRVRVLRATAYMWAVPGFLSSWNVGGGLYSIVMDALLLLFHHAYFGAIDEVQQLPEHELFLSAANHLAREMADSVDRQTMLAMCAEAVGNKQTAAVHYQMASECVKPESHEFLTVQQRYWQCLVEEGNTREAIRVAHDAYARAREEDLEEIQQLGRLALEFSRDAYSAQRPRGPGAESLSPDDPVRDEAKPESESPAED